MARIADALERIADALELPEAAPVCTHPTREIAPTSTMTAVVYRCTECGAEGV